MNLSASDRQLLHFRSVPPQRTPTNESHLTLELADAFEKDLCIRPYFIFRLVGNLHGDLVQRLPAEPLHRLDE
jgi:hypothetical protein